METIYGGSVNGDVPASDVIGPLELIFESVTLALLERALAVSALVFESFTRVLCSVLQI